MRYEISLIVIYIIDLIINLNSAINYSLNSEPKVVHVFTWSDRKSCANLPSQLATTLGIIHIWKNNFSNLFL